VVLPHTLEFSADPHHVLREVERVLVPEGRVVISGFNPASLWGLRQGRSRFWGVGLHSAGDQISTCPMRGVHRPLAPARLAATAQL
jgi:ubiquinone/menaquinone biosynthesis C-methylase UbiE